jgi:hypothetical protein
VYGRGGYDTVTCTVRISKVAYYSLFGFVAYLDNALANSFFRHLGRANARALRDESRDAGVIIEQSYSGPASNRLVVL